MQTPAQGKKNKKNKCTHAIQFIVECEIYKRREIAENK